jgi:hypothetical protein
MGEAARTASEYKRRLLAKVVAAALRGDDHATVDDLQFLLRTVMELDPDAALAALERGWLIAGYGERGYAADHEWWTLGPYGRMFFDFLQRHDEVDALS